MGCMLTDTLGGVYDGVGTLRTRKNSHAHWADWGFSPGNKKVRRVKCTSGSGEGRDYYAHYIVEVECSRKSGLNPQLWPMGRVL